MGEEDQLTSVHNEHDANPNDSDLQTTTVAYQDEHSNIHLD